MTVETAREERDSNIECMKRSPTGGGGSTRPENMEALYSTVR